MGNWIAGAIKHKGALHAQLGIPQGQKIPQATLRRAASAGGKLGERARLAETLEGFHHGGGKVNPRGMAASSAANRLAALKMRGGSAMAKSQSKAMSKTKRMKIAKGKRPARYLPTGGD